MYKGLLQSRLRVLAKPRHLYVLYSVINVLVSAVISPVNVEDDDVFAATAQTSNVDHDNALAATAHPGIGEGDDVLANTVHMHVTVAKEVEQHPIDTYDLNEDSELPGNSEDDDVVANTVHMHDTVAKEVEQHPTDTYDLNEDDELGLPSFDDFKSIRPLSTMTAGSRRFMSSSVPTLGNEALKKVMTAGSALKKKGASAYDAIRNSAVIEFLTDLVKQFYEKFEKAINNLGGLVMCLKALVPNKVPNFSLPTLMDEGEKDDEKERNSKGFFDRIYKNYMAQATENMKEWIDEQASAFVDMYTKNMSVKDILDNNWDGVMSFADGFGPLNCITDYVLDPIWKTVSPSIAQTIDIFWQGLRQGFVERVDRMKAKIFEEARRLLYDELGLEAGISLAKEAATEICDQKTNKMLTNVAKWTNCKNDKDIENEIQIVATDIGNAAKIAAEKYFKLLLKTLRNVVRKAMEPILSAAMNLFRMLLHWVDALLGLLPWFGATFAAVFTSSLSTVMSHGFETLIEEGLARLLGNVNVQSILKIGFNDKLPKGLTMNESLVEAQKLEQKGDDMIKAASDQVQKKIQDAEKEGKKMIDEAETTAQKLLEDKAEKILDKAEDAAKGLVDLDKMKADGGAKVDKVVAEATKKVVAATTAGKKTIEDARKKAQGVIEKAAGKIDSNLLFGQGAAFAPITRVLKILMSGLFSEVESGVSVCRGTLKKFADVVNNKTCKAKT